MTTFAGVKVNKNHLIHIYIQWFEFVDSAMFKNKKQRLTFITHGLSQ